MRCIALLLVAVPVLWCACGHPEPHDVIVIPLDTRYANTPAVEPVFGMYIIDRAAFLSGTDTVTSGDLHTYLDNLPFVLVAAAWADGHMAWAPASHPTEYSISQGSTTPEAISAVREQLLARMDGLARVRPAPLDTDETHIVLFAKSGEKYRVIITGLDIAEPEHFRAPPNDGAVQQPTVVEFRKQWAEARAILLGCTPKVAESESAQWIAFARISN